VPDDDATLGEIEGMVNDCMRVARESFDFTTTGVKVQALGVRDRKTTYLPVGNGGDAVTFDPIRKRLVWALGTQEVLGAC
ncbi:MAG: hypothetical protein ACM4AI_08145, partial [Acidobacteriota bacterium]